MGHKYRKKNRLRAENRRLKWQGKTWLTVPPLIREDLAQSMGQYFVTQLPSASTGVTVGELGPEVVIPPGRENG